MQTFLPYPDFQKSAACLDWRRLGKQRLECLSILSVLSGRTTGWANHPAIKMWRGHEASLASYMDAVVWEWAMVRRYKNNMTVPKVEGPVVPPPWLGDEAFHASHRSNLLRKAPEWYGQFGWSESPDLEYVWPSLQ